MAKDRKSTPLKGLVSLWGRPGYLVRRLHQISVSIFSDEMGDLVTPVQFAALSMAGVAPGIEQTALGEQIGIDRANIADVVARLARSGHIVREVSTRDRRARRIYLTETGKRVVLEANRRFARVHERFLAPLDAQERELFVALLAKMIEANNSLGRAELRLGCD